MKTLSKTVKVKVSNSKQREQQSASVEIKKTSLPSSDCACKDKENYSKGRNEFWEKG